MNRFRESILLLVLVVGLAGSIIYFGSLQACQAAGGELVGGWVSFECSL